METNNFCPEKMRESNTKVFAFSGGCHSGKTTAITSLVKIISENSNRRVTVCGEPMRELFLQYSSIDAFRANPEQYFDAEEKIINCRIQREYQTIMDPNNDIVLIDRALTDSLMYLMLYIRPDKLSPMTQARYYRLVKTTTEWVQNFFTHGYSAVLTFWPIEPPENLNDPFRPKQLSNLAKAEFEYLRFLNSSLCLSPEVRALYKEVSLNGADTHAWAGKFLYNVRDLI